MTPKKSLLIVLLAILVLGSGMLVLWYLDNDLGDGNTDNQVQTMQKPEDNSAEPQKSAEQKKQELIELMADVQEASPTPTSTDPAFKEQRKQDLIKLMEEVQKANPK